MKKFFLFLILSLLSLPFSHAKDYTQYCTPKTPQKTIGGTIASSFGFNFLTRNLIEYQISKTLKKELNSDFDVSIDNFYGINILSGKFKNLKIQSKQANFDGFYISNINAETLCKYNYISYRDKEIKFKENMILKYSSEITQNDLDKTVNSPQYKKIIDKMNNNEYISSLFKIENSKLEIKNNKIYIKYFLKPLPDISIFKIKALKQHLKVSLRGNLEVKDGKIQLCNLKSNSKINDFFSSSIINILNPLNYSFDAAKEKKGNLTVENALIKDNKIFIDGYIVILKD